MGLGDSLKGFFTRRDVPVERLVLVPGESEVARAVGTWRSGTLTSVDGYLLLTTARLVFAVDESGDSVSVLTWSLPWSNQGQAPSTVLNSQIRRGADQPSTADLVAVGVGAAASLVSPPGLVLLDATDRRVEIGILANRLSPNLSHANAVARDRMVAAIHSAISTATAARRNPRQPPRLDQFSWFANDT